MDIVAIVLGAVRVSFQNVCLPSKADICGRDRNVRLVPTTDIAIRLLKNKSLCIVRGFEFRQ
jgi:hypothetical protein